MTNSAHPNASLTIEDAEKAAAPEAERPRRSVLYMPASNTRALEKAKGVPADALIFDLEDAVAPDDKETARAQACAAASGGGYGGREVIIRINGFDQAWGHFDIQKAAVSGADAILLPKVETEDQVWHLEELMAQWGAPDDMAIMCMIETPGGVLGAAAVAAASPRMAALILGTNDLAKDLRVAQTADRAALTPALAQVVLAARAAGIAVIDGVHGDLEDADGLEAACRQGRALGFDGKTLIHPKQIDAANAAFAPSAAEIAEAERIIAGFEASDAGVTVVDGRMVEALHVEAARRTLAMAQRIQAIEGRQD